eukprot:7944872-Alexandrium_andersonii.AAC.1
MQPRRHPPPGAYGGGQTNVATTSKHLEQLQPPEHLSNTNREQDVNPFARSTAETTLATEARA